MEKLKQDFQEQSLTPDGSEFFQEEGAQLWVNSMENDSMSQQGATERGVHTQEMRTEV